MFRRSWKGTPVDDKGWVLVHRGLIRSYANRWIIGQINSIEFSIVWSVAPVLVSVISFGAFVYSGNHLTVAVAFTAVQIFSMIKMCVRLILEPLRRSCRILTIIYRPMNIIPAFLAVLLTTQVAVDRINQFLDEEEVPAFVSSLLEGEVVNSSNGGPSEQDATLGVRNGWFRWNEATESDAKPSKKVPIWKFWKRQNSKGAGNSTLPIAASGANSSNGTGNGATTPALRFELRDINIIFPTGKLTVVTGPTGERLRNQLTNIYI
jgi:ABC-type multidrug transport system fused ATPase/permease subunit